MVRFPRDPHALLSSFIFHRVIETELRKILAKFIRPISTMVTKRFHHFCFTVRHADSRKTGRKRQILEIFPRNLVDGPLVSPCQYLGYFVFTGTARPGIVMLYTCPAWKSSTSIPPLPLRDIQIENRVVRSFGNLETTNPRL